MTSVVARLIEEAKQNWFHKAEKTLAYPETSSKTIGPWLTPFLEDYCDTASSRKRGVSEKAQMFNDYFLVQCTTIDTGSEIPQDTPATTTMISDFVICEELILNIIRSRKHNKALSWDEISVKMIKLSDIWLVLPIKIIFTNCLRRSIFPEIWKCRFIRKMRKIWKGITVLFLCCQSLEKYLKNWYTALCMHILYRMICLTQINQVSVQVTQQSTSYSQ